MFKPERYVCKIFQIDANRVNSRFSLANMNRLEQWKKDDVIMIHMSEVAQREAAAGNDQARRSKAYGYIFTESLPDTPGERDLLREIEKILFPAGVRSENERNDVDVVFNARKYGRILITNDGGSKRQPGGMLGNREKLKELGVVIMTDEEAVRLVEDLILKRDKRARWHSERTGEPLPDWVGKD
jgi:phosphoglycolate phosphatase-like HAD superfamily hydrolase